MLMENFTKERLEESNRLKEKACEDCMRELEGILSDKQMQQFREAFYSASEGYLFREGVLEQK